MKNYVLKRFVKLSLYFFLMYGLLTSIWYGITGRFGENPAAIMQEILTTSAFFSLAFSVLMLTWYKRTTIRIPVKSISKKELRQKVEAAGFIETESNSKNSLLVFKPVPPKASAMAGKIFIEQDINFYQVNGPGKFLKQIWEK